MIRVEGLTKIVGGEVVLEEISFEVRSREALLLMGTNGSGRTMLLEILATLVRPTAGRIELDGIDAVEAPSRVRHRIGYVAESPRFPDPLTVKEHLRFVAAARGLSGGSVARAIKEGLGAARLSSTSRIDTLSAGQRQQLALAGALLADPPFLLLDEGLCRLDPLVRHRFARRLKRQLEKGAQVVAACNSPDRLTSLFDRVVILHQGRIVADREIDDAYLDLEVTLEEIVC